MENNIRVPILAYHGVTNAMSRGIENFSRKHIKLAEFEKQIKFIREKLNPMTLRELADHLCHGYSLPPKAIAVTSDDSYKNVHD